MTEELYINNECVDLGPDTRITLNFKSNILGDISKITASNSQTIRLPKTAKNRRIMNNPSAVAYQSSTRYKRYKARYIRNGVEVVRVAYAVLLSSSECYEIAVYWSVMAYFQAWIDKGGKLNDLEGDESTAWNKDSRATTLKLLKSNGYGYASYDCGVTNTALTNIHPSATAWWILNKIATQAGFTIEIQDRHREALQRMAVPCLSTNAGPESWDTERAKIIIGCKTIREYVSKYPTGHEIKYTLGAFRNKGVSQRRDVYVGDTATQTCKDPEGAGRLEFSEYMAEFSTMSIPVADIYINARAVNVSTNTRICMCVRKKNESYHQTSPVVFKSWNTWIHREIKETINCTGFDYYYFFLQYPVQESAEYQVEINIAPHVDEMIYPSVFRITKNLPEITQIDFIKAICGVLGLFAVADPAKLNNLKFVSLDILQDNKAKAVDWSEKLVCSNDDEPKAVEFKINDYCRNNLFKYKDDDTVTADSDGNLKIDSEVLGREKTVLTLPFAASDGSRIPHYKLSSDGAKAERVQVKDRIMRLVDDGAGNAVLTFAGLDFKYLLSTYYSTLSRLLNGAISISERFTLNEADLKSLDYTIPVYLRQYGKYYGIISIQTSDDTCEVKAVQLPENKIEEVIPPDLITNRIIVDHKWPGTSAISQYKLTSDVTVNFDYYLFGDPEPIAGTEVFPKGTSEVTLMSATRVFDHLELRSVSPVHDDTYSYIITE